MIGATHGPLNCTTATLLRNLSVIRASVDALCRDNAGQISRDPRKNGLKTWRERLARPSKLTPKVTHGPISSYIIFTCRKASYAPPVLCGSIRSHAISQISCHYHYHNYYCSSSVNLTGQYLVIRVPKSIVRASNTPRENPLLRDITISFFSKPAIFTLERVDALILTLNVSRVGGGVYSHQAIFSCS